jgi:SP family facilitated glucose transporter-like MFS transporter 1
VTFKGAVNFRLSFAVFIVALGSSFQVGYNIGVVNAPGEFICRWIKLSHGTLFDYELSEHQLTVIFSTAVAIFTLGAMVGGLLVGYVADRFGRKRSLHFNNILSLTAGTLMVVAKFADFYPLFHVGRFIVGINAGLASGKYWEVRSLLVVSGIVPMFLTELSPIKLRGAFGSIPQLVVATSIFVAQLFGLPFIFGTKDKWIWMFGKF